MSKAINIVCVCVLSHVRLCDPMTVTHQAPLSMEFSRQKYWSGLPFPPQGNLPNSRIEPVPLVLHWQADSLSLCQLIEDSTRNKE